MNRLRLVLSQLHQRLIRHRFNQPVAEQRQRGASDDAVAAAGKVCARRIASRQVGVEGRVQGLLLLARRELASGSRCLASERLGLQAGRKDRRAALRLRTVSEHVIDGKALYRSGIRVVANPDFVYEGTVATHSGLRMTSDATGAVEERSQLRHGLDLSEVELASSEGRKVGDASHDGGQRRSESVEVDGMV